MTVDLVVVSWQGIVPRSGHRARVLGELEAARTLYSTARVLAFEARDALEEGDNLRRAEADLAALGAEVTWAVREAGLGLPRCRQEATDFLGGLERRSVVHVHTPQAWFLAGEEAERLGHRTVYDVHGTLDELKDYGGIRAAAQAAVLRRTETQALLTADAVIAASEPLAGALGRRVAGDLVTVPTGISPARLGFDPATVVEHRRELGAHTWVAYAGSTRPWQRLDLVVATVAAARRRFDLRLAVFTPEPQAAAGVLERTELPQHARLVMTVDEEDLLPWLAACDAGVLIRDDKATNAVAFPTKVAEYLGAGLRLLMSDCLAGPRAMLQGVPGVLLTSAGQPDDLAADLLRLIESPDGQAAAAARKDTARRLAWPSFTPKLAVAYGVRR